MSRSFVHVYDGELLIHSILSEANIGASFGSIARTVLLSICTGRSEEVHVCLDKYLENSIKDSERELRGVEDIKYTITGPEQNMRQKGEKLLRNASFKNEMGKFLLQKWQKDHYRNILNGKILFASFGGECFKYTPTNDQKINVAISTHLQADHEEADTLLALHIEKITASSVLVRAADTDVLVILIDTLAKQCPEDRTMMTVVVDGGSGNNRRYINITNIVNVLELRKPGLSRAIPGYHAFTRCNFTSSFYR